MKKSDVKFFNPQGYTGLYAFHKYWGKKPMEAIGFLVEHLSDKNDIICDPFLGSGVAAIESLIRGRRFIGIDINPVSIELSKLLISPPNVEKLQEAFQMIEKSIKEEINSSYKRERSDEIATHYLWNNDKLISVWTKERNKRLRKENIPQKEDLVLFKKFKNYKCRILESGNFFQNSRINSYSNMDIYDLFTGRALRNIEIILSEIEKHEEDIKRALKLCLTAASGQMSKMVFAITNRGKTSGKRGARIEVGSWIIGYWKPKLHFEINVWNCFSRRVNKLLRAIQYHLINNIRISSSIQEVIRKNAEAALIKNDANKLLQSIPDYSIHLILTDPPHSDRIPYLELSQMWNLILGEDSDFEKEIVISNAKERRKSRDKYLDDMYKFVLESSRCLSKGGFLALIFNAREKRNWSYYRRILEDKNVSLKYKGYFPLVYSAGSVVQDNRAGSLEADYILIFEKENEKNHDSTRYKKLRKIEGWKSESPKVGEHNA